MSSLFANKIKINLCLVSNKPFIVRTMLSATVRTYTTYTTITTTRIACRIFFSADNLFVCKNTRTLDLFSGDIQSTTIHFTLEVSSRKTY